VRVPFGFAAIGEDLLVCTGIKPGRRKAGKQEIERENARGAQGMKFEEKRSADFEQRTAGAGGLG
jgi:hypothetical protein